MTRAPVKRPFIGVRTPLAEFTAALVKTIKNGFRHRLPKMPTLIESGSQGWLGRRIRKYLSTRLPASLGSHPLAFPRLSIIDQ